MKGFYEYALLPVCHLTYANPSGAGTLPEAARRVRLTDATGWAQPNATIPTGGMLLGFRPSNPSLCTASSSASGITTRVLGDAVSPQIALARED